MHDVEKLELNLLFSITQAFLRPSAPTWKKFKIGSSWFEHLGQRIRVPYKALFSNFSPMWLCLFYVYLNSNSKTRSSFCFWISAIYIQQATHSRARYVVCSMYYTIFEVCFKKQLLKKTFPEVCHELTLCNNTSGGILFTA